ncbi:hypothetical protein [Mesorhizobium sp.]|uniref:hypothetical protein n=1 Tax=Mesorhizobium sp. TaxID=1871066 RepID=UPI000FEA456C|nr:hypothetical protein [Mesorhizobium sp.]RWB34599.1 MAG: hypothetical protein EOQ41_09090 [Mesorhizobium sp.]RWD43963.1 MAG: hypothetical protein EOS35_18995 [Mesorhizobium sp.]TIT16244.1 MAG: hypothetical protein E5W85_04035 [Mesorhizobium sp.]
MAYFMLRAQFSCPFYDDRMSIGWTYLPAATEYVAKNAGQSCGLLIADFIGDTDKIWPRTQIFAMWGLLLLFYVAAVTFVAMTVVRLMDHVRDN